MEGKKNPTLIKFLQVGSMELDRKTCIDKGILQTVWAGIRQICIAIHEFCNFGFQFPYRGKKIYFF